MTAIKIAFWISAALVFYTYIGYGMLLWLLLAAKRLVKGHQPEIPMPADDELPAMTFLVCAFNEQDVVDQKMENIRQLDYPREKLHVMWVTDGSDDDTNTLLSRYDDVEIVFTPERRGKTAALNHGISRVKTELTVMTDANTMVNPDALREIARCFTDKKVGCVAGEKRVIARNDSQTAAHGEGLYWKYESRLKQWDSELHSAMGAAGELNAIRTSLYEPMPEEALLDDFVMSMRIVARGYKIAYTSHAYAMEYGSASIEEESKRKRRIAAGGLQSCWWLRALMNPLRYPLTAFQLVSHRVLRWTITPFALLALVPLNVLLVMMKGGTVYTVTWLLQILFYLMALGGHLMQRAGRKSSLLFAAYYFLFMNLNVFKGFAYLKNRTGAGGAWEKAKRG